MKHQKFIYIVIIILFLFSCNKKETESYKYINEIKNFHNTSIGQKLNTPNGNQAIYVDFSDGMYQAYDTETNKKVMEYISNSLAGKSDIDWYGMGRDFGGIGKLEYTEGREIYNKVTSKDNFKDMLAPIEESLKKITASSNDALLITDFEEYIDGKEQEFAYPRKHFAEWIKKGNSITLYYSKYNENNPKTRLTSEKNLYFVIFSYGKINDNSLLKKFEKETKGRLEGLKKFEINPIPYSVSNNYGGENKTGLYPKTDELIPGNESGVIINYYNNKECYEAFEFGLNINDLYKYYFAENKRFASKLILDASNNISHYLKNIKVKVTDITDNYEHYLKCLEAQKNKPNLVKDEGNNNVWDEASKGNEIIVECYKENTTELKENYVYKYVEGENVSEIFDFDTNVFSDRLKNSPNEIELITTFHKNFIGNYQSDKEHILRIDFVVEDTDENISQLDDFKWNSIINKGKINTSLYESIRGAIVEVKPKGIIYSYYLKFDKTK